MTRADLYHLLKLSSVPGIGSGKLRLLVTTFGSAQNVLNAAVQSLVKVPGIDTKTAIRIKKEFNEIFVEEQIRLLDRLNCKICTIFENDYPESLKRIYDPPALIYLRGSYTAADHRAIAIVGTRHPSVYGIQATEKLAAGLAEYGFTIVSGLARGIDTIAHRTALLNKTRTIAVLGSGLDHIYPYENYTISKEIVKNGAVFSEYAFGTLPDGGNFPRRNRIISGLSKGVLVVEAGNKSGALITAYEALEQNREVFAVPGPISSDKSAGTNLLLKEGAKLVQSVDDILSEIGPPAEHSLPNTSGSKPELKKTEQEIYALLSNEPLHVDRLAQLSNLSPSQVLSTLLTLELLGYSKQLAGKLFIRL